MMERSEFWSLSVSNWVYGFSRQVARLGWRSARVFHAGAAALVGLGVMVVLLGVDQVSWNTAIAGGVLAMLPAAMAGVIALKLSHALARTTRLDDPLGEEDEEIEGIWSQRSFLRQVEREWSRCRRYGDRGALLLIDVDHLDQMSASLGHRHCEVLLRAMAHSVQATLRQSDILGRFSGVELAVFLPHTDPLGALDAAERIRHKIASTPFTCHDAEAFITISLGVSHAHLAQETVNALLTEAETALRLAQDAGHNCVRSAPLQPRHDDAAPSPVPH